MNSLEKVLSYHLTGNFWLDARESMQRMRSAGSKSWGIILLLMVILSGCRTHSASAPVSDYYYLNPNNRLISIGRVAIVELDNDSSYPQISADVTQALYQALQKRQIFGLTVIRQHDPSWRSLQLDRDSTYTLEQLLAIREA